MENMSVITESTLIECSEEYNVIKSKFYDVVGQDMDHYINSVDVIKYYIEIVLHGEIFKQYTTNPLSTLFEGFNMSKESMDYILEDIENLIADKIFYGIDPGIADKIKSQYQGYDSSCFNMAGLNFVIDIVVNHAS